METTTLVADYMENVVIEMGFRYFPNYTERTAKHSISNKCTKETLEMSQLTASNDVSANIVVRLRHCAAGFCYHLRLLLYNGIHYDIRTLIRRCAL